MGLHADPDGADNGADGEVGGRAEMGVLSISLSTVIVAVNAQLMWNVEITGQP